MSLSIIIPTLNEAERIAATLDGLQPLRRRGVEIIVVDGGSADATVALAQNAADRVIAAERGRARQMNAGAAAARGEILCFLHAGTRLPENADGLIIDSLARGRRSWGHFDVNIDGRHPMLRIIARMMNWRSRLTGIATGRQAIFITRSLFEAAGHFPDIPLMEDIALSRQLKTYSRPLRIAHRLTTSGRCWEQHWERQGLWRTLLLTWRLRLGCRPGADPRKRTSRDIRSPH
ncbi:MAG: TIGR04283 family arsenosugar biosynthesis glycosyltransferase [Burkholderiales bacterium]|nr:TIGR04283 family arsenosugar biosynthesis glycosyltransferase [Burkholderiales bacterium]